MKIVFFNGDVKDFVENLSKGDRTKFIRVSGLLGDVGFRLAMPFSKKVGHKLYELRIIGDASTRIFYTFHNHAWVLLHAFIKKTDRIPSRELSIAVTRLGKLE